MKRTGRPFGLCQLALAGLAFGPIGAACGQARPRVSTSVPSAPPPAKTAPSAPIELRAALQSPAFAESDAGIAGSDASLAGWKSEDEPRTSGDDRFCPEGMALVDTDYCPVIDRTCVESEYNVPNHITICHKFSQKQRCIGKRQHRRFCIDQYEYPNRRGAHPPWMVSWYDAQATCEAVGKRLCLESEWVAACEGPKETPFPYGWERDHAKCNVDNLWIEPSLREVYAKDRFVQMQELSRLDQSVPSGELPECVSGFGVHDMTGNFDEWVTADERHEDRSEWAGLKGGAWGHVRNACRPVTTSHPPDFTYYFISFRCCKDPEGEPLADQIPEYSPRSDPPKVEPADRAPPAESVYPAGPSRIKVSPIGPKSKPDAGVR